MNEELICQLCKNESPLIKWLSDEGQWIWLGVDCAAAKGNPTAVYLQTSAWIDNQIQRVIPVEGVQ